MKKLLSVPDNLASDKRVIIHACGQSRRLMGTPRRARS